MNEPTELTILEEVFPGDTNPYGTAFGGKILALMDRAAGLCASRWAHQHFVTAAIDVIAFLAPVRQGEVAEVKARVVYTTRRTCGVKVEVAAVDKTSWEQRPCCHGLLFMVAMSPEGEPLPLPAFEPETEVEKSDWAEAAVAHTRALQARH